MDAAEHNIEDYYSMPDKTFSWFPEAWAEDEDEAVKMLQEADPEHQGVSTQAFSATRVSGRVVKKKAGEPWFWVCKPTHPHAAPYWQLARDPDAIQVPRAAAEQTQEEKTAETTARVSRIKDELRMVRKAK